MDMGLNLIFWFSTEEGKHVFWKLTEADEKCVDTHGIDAEEPMRN